VAYRNNIAGLDSITGCGAAGCTDSIDAAADRVFIRRDQNMAPNGSLGTLDFAGPEAFSPDTAPIIVAGLRGGETVRQGMEYSVGATCERASGLYGGAMAGPSFLANGIPETQQRVGDYHRIGITVTDGTNNQYINEYFHTLDARTVTLGPEMPTPTITSLTGPYKRLRAAYTLPPEYQSAVTVFQYGGVQLRATPDYLGGPAVTLEMPDFSGLAGWRTYWAPGSTDVVEWSAWGNEISGLACTEGARTRTAFVVGTF
jgi:hypothetical protein